MKNITFLILTVITIWIIIGCNQAQKNSETKVNKVIPILNGKYEQIKGKFGWQSLEFKSNGEVDIITILGDKFSNYYKYENGMITVKSGQVDIYGDIEENGNIRLRNGDINTSVPTSETENIYTKVK